MGTFTAGDRFRDADEQFAEIRQSVLDGLKRTIDDAKSAWLFPDLLVEAITNEIWKYPRKTDYFMAEPMPLPEFIKAPYPRGLGTKVEIIEKLIAGNERAMLAWDRAFRGEHGGAHNPTGRNQHATQQDEAAEVNVDNIHVDQPDGTVRPDGTSTQAGLRRLEKAAQAGDGNAAEMLRRVLDPDDAMTVHGACVALGWRKPTRTVVDTDDGLSDAVVRRLGPLDTVRQAWRRATAEQREQIAAWFEEQMRGAAP